MCSRNRHKEEMGVKTNYGTWKLEDREKPVRVSKRGMTCNMSALGVLFQAGTTTPMPLR